MDYPNDFNIKSFPAGKTIAFSRSVSIWISIVFFLIVSMCGLLLLCVHFKQNYPFLISIDPFTEEWTVVAYPGKNKKESVQQYQIMQEKLVHDFVTNWFTISGNKNLDENRWQDCDVEDCTQPKQFNPENIYCAISCKSDSLVYKEFTEKILPQYRTLTQASGRWTVGPMLITPIDVNQASGTWQVYATIYSNKTTAFDVLVFITIERDQTKYPATLGYYIKNFNSYRVVNE